MTKNDSKNLIFILDGLNFMGGEHIEEINVEENHIEMIFQDRIDAWSKDMKHKMWSVDRL